MNDWKILLPENKQIGAEEIYFENNEQLLRLGCINCFARVETTVDDILQDNHIACPECLSTRDVDVADLMLRRDIIKKAVADLKNKNNS